MTGSTPSPTATFRKWLAGLDDAALATIVRNRPDAAHPLPPGIDALATRLLLRQSVARALAECTAAELLAAERLAADGAELEPASPPPEDAQAIEGLTDKALAFPAGDKVYLASEVIPALPTDWSLLDQAAVSPEDLAQLDDSQRHILNTLLQAGGTGTTRDAAPDADPSRPIPQLLAAGLLQRVDSRTVRLPRAVRSALRGEDAAPIPTQPSGRAGQPGIDKKADEAGAAAGLEVVRLVGELIDAVGYSPIELLKDKSLGVRSVKQLAKSLNTTPTDAARLVGLGFAAGLLGRGEPKGFDGNFLGATTRGLDWQEAELSERWAVLIDAWLNSPWATWMSTRGIDPETNRPRLNGFRDRVLSVYRHTDGELAFPEFLEELRFRFPLFASSTAASTIENLHAEAERVGLIARGRATSVLIRAEDEDISAVTAELTPATVDQFIVQADMTILAPGPLEPDIRKRLATIAELESPGLASVYRLSENSLRRGLDHGATAGELADFLREHAIGEVPQTVTYLLDDLTRRHGTLRSGAALCYVRSEDPALLADATRHLPQLRLIAPTVAVSTLRLSAVLDKLREQGFSPAAEDETGASIDARPEPATVPLPSPRARPDRGLDIDKVVRSIRDHDGDDADGSTDASPSLDLLHVAARGGRPVSITYADKNGTPRTITATPLSVNGGQADVLTGGQTVRFPLHRISAISLS